MIPIRYTRRLFLRAICVVYLFAFVSFYIQIPGLYGDNGVLPARAVLENSKHKTFSAKAHYQPTLLWFAPYLGLDTNYALDVLALLGVFFSFSGFISQKFCTIPLFTTLWSLYFSLYQVGQVFVSSQWDDLLLEAGFLALLVAPLLPKKKRWTRSHGSPKYKISFFMVKWLLFRFLVSSGLTKLLSGCPKWWDLTAMNYYFETMVLPTPLSWYAHHLPIWILKLITILSHFVEIVVPFLFFVPIRSTRITAYVIQMFFQIAAYATGNYNFLNILLTTLLLSLLDDQVFFSRSFPNKSTFQKWLGYLTNFALFAGILLLAVMSFNLKINGNQIHSSVAFTRHEFNSFAKMAILYGIYIGIASLGLTILSAITSSVTLNGSFMQKLSLTLQTSFYGILAVTLFMGSTYPLASLHSATNTSVISNVKTIHNRLSKLHVINTYGLFKKIPADGRLEVVIEGASNIEGPWHEYGFLYKPGNVNGTLPFVAPYSPRLDWQMWFGAQSSYEKEPWMLSLAHRLLLGKQEVLNLLDRGHVSYAILDKPPKFVRGSLYKYKFTPWNERWGYSWWKRERIGEFFPAFTKDSAALLDTLRARNLLPNPIKPAVHPLWQQSLDSIRYVTNYMEASLLMWSVFTAGCAIITTTTKTK